MTPFSLSRRLTIAALAGAAALVFSVEAFAQQQQRRSRQAPAQPPAAAAQQPQTASLTPETTAKQAIILDFKTGKVLFEKNADQRMPPSSMSKIMTAYMAFKALKENRLQLDSMLPVSQKAWRIQGSKMFVMVGTQVKVEDLLRGMIIQSGNDACIVLAEGLAGSEEAFAEQMNVEARKIGLTASNFRNASGWPDPDHYTTARDLAILGKRLIADFPEYYKYYSEIDFTYGTDDKGKPIKQGNRNPLLYKNVGADGIKTGHTEEAGYGLTASTMRDGRRIVGVFNGWQSMRIRSEESERMMEWAFREWGTYALFKKGETIDKADVWLGTKPTVQLLAPQDVDLTIPRRLRPQLKVVASFDSPIAAPIAPGQEIGRLVITASGLDTMEIPLVS
ncbi:MAG: D-alanyl-D-alanine carboxypeptidase, partial [Alphaproteobacteria bacterium]|nr:D-alanyl-D-alanine carboxypeptidase [Alphaproteobacteria bacterium]